MVCKRGFASLCLPLVWDSEQGSFRGVLALLFKNYPLPLFKGKGIKGIGLINNLKARRVRECRL